MKIDEFYPKKHDFLVLRHPQKSRAKNKQKSAQKAKGVSSSFEALFRYFWRFFDVFFQVFLDSRLEGTFSILSAKLAPQSTLLEVILKTFGCPGGNVKTVFSYWF